MASEPEDKPRFPAWQRPFLAGAASGLLLVLLDIARASFGAGF